MSRRPKEDPFVRLRELLALEASEDTFTEILEVFEVKPWSGTDDWPDEETRALALEYALGHLEDWPVTTREGRAVLVWPDCPAGEPLPCFSLVRWFDLSSNNHGARRFGPEGAKQLAQSPHLSGISTLHLWGNAIGDEGITALANSPHLHNLKELRVFGNLIGDQGAFALAQSSCLPKLETLSLGYNQIGDAGAQALADATQYKHLDAISLNNNNLTEVGLCSLAFCTRLSSEMRRYYLNKLTHATLSEKAQQQGLPDAPSDKDALIDALLPQTTS